MFDFALWCLISSILHFDFTYFALYIPVFGFALYLPVFDFALYLPVFAFCPLPTRV